MNAQRSTQSQARVYILTELCADADQLQQLLEKEGVQGQHNEAANSYLQADTAAGQRNAIISDYIIRILGLDVRPSSCSAPAYD